MDVGRRSSGVRNSVAAGSVWESRMKSDEVKGGIKVYNGEESSNNPQIEETNYNDNNNNNNHKNGDSRRIVKKGQSGNVVGVSGKRKTWKAESFNGPILQIAAAAAKGKNSNLDEQSKELSVSVDEGIKRSSGLNKKGRSEEGNQRSPIQTRKTRSEILKVSSADSCSNKEMVVHSGEGLIEKNQSVLRKSKSESVKAVDQTGNGVEKSSSASVQLRKVKSESNKDFVNPCDGKDDESGEGHEKFLVENEVIGSEENCKEFDVCEEKMIPSDVTNVCLINKSLPEVLTNNHDSVDDGDEEFDEEKEDEEVEFEEVEEVEKKEIKINVPEQKQKQSPEKIAVNEVKKFNQFHDKSAPISSTVNKEPPPVIRRAAIYSNFSKPTSSSFSDDFQSFPETQNKLQNLVDLVMWRDVSKSAFVFGIGTFIIFSSSYTTDLNISFISVISYLGLVYLAAIFLYRAIICRGVIMDDSSYVVGEDEAIWLLKLILPYLNEFLLKLKALFSCDPATTMKLAVLLFVLARGGSSITIWKMAKLGFFGVFILPKVCSSYSTQLAGYGKFWIRRFRDAWDSCSHKKVVSVVIFALVWNLSSMVARIWAVFMLFVAFRYYQQSMVRDDWLEDETAGSEETCHPPQNAGQKETYRPNNVGFVPNRLRPNRLRPTIEPQVKPKKLS